MRALWLALLLLQLVGAVSLSASSALALRAQDEVDDALLPLGDSIVVYHIFVVISPDDPTAGTQDGVNLRMVGSSSSMKEAVPFAAGFTNGQEMDLNCVSSNVGTIKSMELSMAEAVPDDALIEVLSIDKNYGLPEDGNSRYTNFANVDDAFIRADQILELKPVNDYVVIVRTSNFIHAATMNEVSIRFLGSSASSEVLLLSENGFGIGESSVFTLQSDYPMVTQIKQIELSILFKNDDLWMPDSFHVFTPTQRVKFHNSETQFIGFKPYIIASDDEKLSLLKAGKDYK